MKRLLSAGMGVCWSVISINAVADLQLPAVFSDNMVLQQGTPVAIWGWADEGEKVIVKFRGQTASATTHNLKWALTLRSAKAGGPETLTVATRSKTIMFTNVLVGEVWICSGQSNMEWPLSSSYQSKDDIAAATNTLIRLLRVPKEKAEAPTVRLNAAWTECSPQTAAKFSAVGYYFGRDLQAARNVPVGLIQTDWGGSPAEVWMSREALEINDRYREEILESGDKAWRQYQDQLAQFRARKIVATRDGVEFTNSSPRFGWRPTELYNAMIAPLIPYTIKGAIWYQGESNAGRAEQYRSLFMDMIRNWRRDWQDDFSFLCVQLAPWDKRRSRSMEEITSKPEDSDWAELREAQFLATRELPNVGMTVITDVGDKDDIHPTKKEAVGERLALAARGIAYGEKITHSGPIYRSMEVEDDKIILRFRHVGKGLEARDGELKGFAICGQDRKFVWAKAEIGPDNTVIVSSPEISKPIAVRFGWSDFPVVNLWNKDGLPASPFRTDDFPMITAGKH